MSVRSHVMTRVIDQFHHPRGIYGRIAGQIMATRDTNVARNEWIAEILDPPSGARNLEIGHGPGIAIEALVPRLVGGHITGLEISELMSRAAAKRNDQAIARGIVDFRVGDSVNPPTDLSGFDVIYAVNASMFWTDPVAAITELTSRLNPGGEIVFVYMPPPTSSDSAAAIAAETAELFATAAGLIDIRHDETSFEPTAIATRGTRPE
jgi:SAM-dependent methyltransferase